MDARGLTVAQFLERSKNELVIDVRAPIEFAKGHLIGAVNIPLFEDAERAEIGTIYKQQGKETAVTRGLEIVSPKMLAFSDQVHALAKNKKVFVYCFRGGMRSNSFAWLMNISGLDACILTGGYKAYRNYVLHSFEKQYKIVLLGGSTGSGKTAILAQLAMMGFQIVDLERIALHKGSAFGAINEQKQLPQQMFEHKLFDAFSKLDRHKIIVLEDESQSIGYNKLPYPLWLQMKQATIVKLDIPVALRVAQLVADYATVDTEALKACVAKIAEKLGPDHTKQCMQQLDVRDYASVAQIALKYYDKAYTHLYKKKNQEIITIVSDVLDALQNAQKVMALIETIQIN